MFGVTDFYTVEVFTHNGVVILGTFAPGIVSEYIEADGGSLAQRHVVTYSGGEHVEPRRLDLFGGDAVQPLAFVVLRQQNTNGQRLALIVPYCGYCFVQR